MFLGLLSLGCALCACRNATVGPCKCAASQWQKMPKSGLWVQAISPYDHRILDFRMPADPSRSVVVSTEEGMLSSASFSLCLVPFFFPSSWLRSVMYLLLLCMQSSCSIGWCSWCWDWCWWWWHTHWVSLWCSTMVERWRLAFSLWYWLYSSR